MKRQGARTDITSSPLATKSGIRSDEELAEQVGEGKDNIRRYIRLTELLPELLDMVDNGRIALRPAVELSYLTKEEQANLLETISYEDSTPSLAQALKMKQFSKEGHLNSDVILSIMCGEKGNQKEKITLKAETYRKYLPSNVEAGKQTEDYIIKALEYYQRYRERQKEQER